ncbi:unnamed protein product [Brassica rapa subsp. narinosa]
MFYVSSSLFLILCFFFCTLCFVVLVCSSSSAQFFVSSLVSSNPTISHKRYVLAWLFLDVSTNSSLLYTENKRTRRERKCTFRQEWQSMQKSCGSCWKKKDNTFVYMCGLKGMEKGIDEIMISLAAKDGIDWLEYKKQLKRSEQRNVEVY